VGRGNINPRAERKGRVSRKKEGGGKHHLWGRGERKALKPLKKEGHSGAGSRKRNTIRKIKKEVRTTGGEEMPDFNRLFHL